MPEPLPMTLTLQPPNPALRFRSLHGREEMGRLFEYEVRAVSEDPAIDLYGLLGKPGCVEVDLGPGAKRHFHGIVARASFDGSLGRENAYTLVLRPWLWLMTRSTDLRIFQGKTVPDIVKLLLDEYSSDYQIQLDGSFPQLEYCVQYRESDFDFVSRLMEEYGIYYFFRHEAAKHVAVLANASGAHRNENDIATVPFREAMRDFPHRPVVAGWRFRQQVRSGKISQWDYYFETPQNALKHTTIHGRPRYTHDDHEQYDHPGRFVDGTGGDLLTMQRSREEQARFSLASGETTTPAFVAGAKFTLSEHGRDDQNGDWIVTALQIEMFQAGYESGVDSDTLVHCRFDALPATETFRAESLTPKPRTRGPQTAFVVGPAGDEIHVDKYGRVKVQFHWDREGQKNENSTCYMRVLQRTAAKGWGMVWIPRIGHEVLVDFLEGDPDRPMVVGSVYNAVNMPPYTLPDNATVSTIKSHSTKGGGAKDFNEIRFEDLKGSEYWLEQAQKDKHEFVKNILRSDITKDEHRTVGGKRNEKIGAGHSMQIGGGAMYDVGAKWSLTTKEDMLIKTGTTWGLKVGSDLCADASQGASLKAGMDIHMKAGMNFAAEAGMAVHIKGGMTVVIEAGVQLSLKAGGSFVDIGPAGVAISGPMVLINSGGAAGSGSGSNPVAPTAPEKPEAPEPPEDPLSHFA